MIDGFVINGTHTLAQRLAVVDSKTADGRVRASYRCGPYGWYVSIDGKPCEIYLASKEDAEECLRGVEEALTVDLFTTDDLCRGFSSAAEKRRAILGELRRPR